MHIMKHGEAQTDKNGTDLTTVSAIAVKCQWEGKY